MSFKVSIHSGITLVTSKVDSLTLRNTLHLRSQVSMYIHVLVLCCAYTGVLQLTGMQLLYLEQ